jgi:hypothetical protein
MKLRRLIQIASRGQSLAKSSVVRHSKIGLPMSQLGQSRRIDMLSAIAACPLRSESGQKDKRFGKSALCQLPTFAKCNSSLFDVVVAVSGPQSDANKFEGNTEDTPSLGAEVLTIARLVCELSFHVV